MSDRLSFLSRTIRVTAIAGERWLLAHTLAVIATILLAFFYRAIAAGMRALANFGFTHDVLPPTGSISNSKPTGVLLAPPANVYSGSADLCAWPKTLSDLAWGEPRFLGISGCRFTMAALDPFRPGRIHSITRRRVWPDG